MPMTADFHGRSAAARDLGGRRLRDRSDGDRLSAPAVSWDPEADASLARGETVTPTIPLLDIGARGAPALLEQGHHLAVALIEGGRRDFGAATIDLLDGLSRRWARRLASPYREELQQVAERLPRGAFFMNLSYNWGCTTGVAADPSGIGMRLLRTLDWPFHGIGRNVVVARQRGPAGEFLNVTWPGYVGMVTGCAPGRFAAAINQAPMRHRGPWPWPVDWLVNRWLAYRSTRAQPDHLLREVFEVCPDYAAARQRLIETAPALPALYSLVGCAPGEACVIERLEDRVLVHDGTQAVANQWLTEGLAGRPRGDDNEGRQRDMLRLCPQTGDGFDWVQPPILNRFTRVAVAANPARGSLQVQGYEVTGPATQPFALSDASAAA